MHEKVSAKAQSNKPPRNPKRKPKRDSEVVSMHDVSARQAGPDKVCWTKHDLADFAARNERQRDAIRAYGEGDDLALVGAAGAGKTLLAAYLAGSSMVNREENIEQIIVVRTAVQERDQGFLPGTEEEKLDPYSGPYRDAFAIVFDHPTSFDWLVAKKKLIFTSSNFKRGVNFRNAVVILDEVQNFSFKELNTLYTRLNECCRLIITGDSPQCDLGPREESGLPTLLRLAESLHRLHVVKFTWDDCQRGERVKRWLQVVEQHLSEKKQ